MLWIIYVWIIASGKVQVKIGINIPGIWQNSYCYNLLEPLPLDASVQRRYCTHQQIYYKEQGARAWPDMQQEGCSCKVKCSCYNVVQSLLNWPGSHYKPWMNQPQGAVLNGKSAKYFLNITISSHFQTHWMVRISKNKWFSQPHITPIIWLPGYITYVHTWFDLGSVFDLKCKSVTCMLTILLEQGWWQPSCHNHIIQWPLLCIKSWDREFIHFGWLFFLCMKQCMPRCCVIIAS